MSKLGRCSGRNSESRNLVVVDSHGRIPSDEQVAQCAVEGFGSGLQSAVGQVILTGDEAKVAVITARSQGLADDDLEVALLVVPVPEVAAVDADDDRFLRERLAIIRAAFQANRLLAAKISFMAGS